MAPTTPTTATTRMTPASPASPASALTEFDVSGYVRRARRLGDLSQRDLAERAGIDQAIIARIEGGGDTRVHTLARLLAAGGLRLAVVDVDGAPVPPMPTDVFRDRGGRRRPAHLDVHAAPEAPTPKMLMHDVDPVPVGGAWHHLRSERDRIRKETGSDARGEQLTATAARERQAARRRR